MNAMQTHAKMGVQIQLEVIGVHVELALYRHHQAAVLIWMNVVLGCHLALIVPTPLGGMCFVSLIMLNNAEASLMIKCTTL